MIANNITSYLTTPNARLQVSGGGSTSSTYTAQFHNSTGINNAFVIRDDGNIGIGTSSPVSNLDITTTSGNSIITMKGNAGVLMSMYRYSNNVTRPRYEMYKARGDQVAPLVVQAGDELGSMDFYGYDGSAFQRNAIILVNAASVSGAIVTPKLSFGLGASANSNDYYFSLNQTGAVFSGGNSTSITPLGRLHLKGSTSDNTANAFYVENSATTNLLTVRNDGFIGVGTTNPLSMFHINKASSVNSSPTYSFQPLVRLTEDQSNSAAEIAMESNNGQGGLLFSRSVSSGGISSGSGLFRIRVSGSTGIGTHSSMYQIMSVGVSENWTPTANGVRFLFSPTVNGTTSSISMMAINGDGVFVGSDSISQPTLRFGIRGIGTSSSTYALSVQNSSLTTVFNVRDDGNVGVGIAAPLYKFHVEQPSNAGGNPFVYLRVANTDGAILRLSNLDGGTSIIENNDIFQIQKNSVFVFSANPVGNVGIGNSTPSYQLQVGSGSVVGIVSRFQNSTGTCDINPTTTSLSCSSDRTLKTNITNLNNTILNQITSLQPVTYTWINDNTNQQQTGFIAQDVEQIFPSLVSTDPTTNLKSLNYIGLIPYAIEGIRELDIKVNQLSSLDTTLQGSFAFLLKEVLGNVSNGINELYVKVVKSDRVETDNIKAKTICLGTTCINEEQLIQIMNQNNIQQPVPQNQNTEIIPETIPPTEPVVEEVVE